MSEGKGGVVLARRVILVPTSIIRETADALSAVVNDDGVPLSSRHRLPMAEDSPAWTALKQAAAASYAPTIADPAGDLRGEAVTVVAGGTTIHVATPQAPSRADGALIEPAWRRAGAGRRHREPDRRATAVRSSRLALLRRRLPHPAGASLSRHARRLRPGLSLRPRAPCARQHRAHRAVGGRQSRGDDAAARRDAGLPMPAGLVLLSPQIDLTELGDSFAVNRTIDVVLPV